MAAFVSPGDTAIIAFKTVLLYEAGDGDGARALVDFERFLRSTRIAPPAGFDNLADFNAAIARFALQHPTLVQEPRNNAAKDGKHTAELLAGTKGPMAGLTQAIESAVLQYVQGLPQDLAHPFVVNRPAKWRLSAWAVVMEGRDTRCRTFIPRHGSAESTTPEFRQASRRRRRRMPDGSSSGSRCRSSAAQGDLIFASSDPKKGDAALSIILLSPHAAVPCPRDTHQLRIRYRARGIARQESVLMSRKSLIGLMTVVAAGIVAVTMAPAGHTADNAAAKVAADTVRSRGFPCTEAISAERHPDEEVWVLVCSDARYRVQFKGDMPAKVERLP